MLREGQPQMGTRYFQRALWLPLIVPVGTFLALGYLDLILDLPPTVLNDLLPGVAGLLAATLVFGGVQYIACIAWALKQLDQASVTAAIRFWWRFPLVFFAVELVTLEALAIPLGASTGRWDSFVSGVTAAAAISACALPLGYLYSAIVVGGYHLGQWWLQRCCARGTRDAVEP